MSKIKLYFFYFVLIIAAGVIFYDKQMKPTVEKLGINISPVDYYKIMWFGSSVKAIDALNLNSLVQNNSDTIYLIDLRPEIIYFTGHIKGSLSMSFHDFLSTPVNDFKKIHKKLIFISQGDKKSKLVCKLLAEKGLNINTAYLKGGIENWEYKRYEKKEDFPKEAKISSEK